MTTPLEFPLINGFRHGFSSVELKFQFNGKKVQVFLKSINYSITRSRSKVEANHPDPIAKTRGTNEYSADIELYTAESQRLLAELGDGYADVPFLTLVTWGENGFDTVTDELHDCTIDSTEVSAATGSDATVRKHNLNPIKIKLNGKDDLEFPLLPPPEA